MKQNEKGITIVGLIITVLVIVIIAGVCIYTGRDILEEAKLEQLKTNMLLIQAKCHSIQDKVTAKEEASYIGEKIDDTSILAEKYGVTIQSDDNWYELSKEDVEQQEYTTKDSSNNNVTKQGIGLGNIDVANGDYIVNYTDGEVIYTKGYNGEFKLSDLLK